MLIPILILSVAAQIQVNGNFRRYSAVRNRRGLTGAQAAEAVLRTHGVTDVAIRPVRGSLTDHYDPRDNTIYLSETVYAADTVAAVGVAAHEAGHAVQYAEGYAPVRLRSAIVSVTNLSSQASMVLLFIGLFLYSQMLFGIGILLFSVTTFFQLVTLPVEFNASRRGLKMLTEGGYISYGSEEQAARKVLRAAAMTYVVAALSTFLTFLRLVMMASRNRRR